MNTIKDMENDRLDVRLAHEYLADVEKILESRGDMPDLPISSLPGLNDLIWGIPKGNMTVIGARTSVGKTTFVLQMVHDMLMNNKSVLYITFEMTYTELLERMFVHHCSVNNIGLQRGHFYRHKEDWEKYKEWIGKAKLVINDGVGRTMQRLEDFLCTIEKIPDVIIVDYMQALAGASTIGKSYIDEFLRRFKQLCHLQNFAGIIVSQVNRQNPDAKDKRPQLHQLKGSGFLEEHADMCLLLDWEIKHNANADKELYLVNVAKNRNGKTGYIQLRFRPGVYTFEDWGT